MSVSIDTNKLKFVIFGSGHDYTLLDSGEGEKMIFSHPYVPLNSVNYAGQYYFEVPDENGDFFDAVKDDLSHCTFDPPLNTAFDTEGETTVSVHYRREYIHDEETILVEKRLSQKVTVVDHGAVVSSASTNYKRDIYADGYCFCRPYPDNYVGDLFMVTYSMNTSPILKMSSLPWRVTSLGRNIEGFLDGRYSSSIDLSELAFADVSKVTVMKSLFYSVVCNDWTFLKAWNTESVTEFHALGVYSNLSDLTVLSDWNMSNATDISGAFSSMLGVTTLHGLENWDVSNVTNLASLVSVDTNLTDISALENWDVSSVISLNSTFEGCTGLASLHGLENWDVSNATDLYNTFHNLPLITSLSALSNWAPIPTTMIGTFSDMVALTSLEGIEKFDVSNCANMQTTFNNDVKLLTLKGVETWDTSNVVIFTRTFGNIHWVKDLTPVAGWSFASATNTQWMFGNVDALLDVDDVIFDLSNVTSPQNMFATQPFGWAPEISKEVYKVGHDFYTYEGQSYSELALQGFVEYSKDASNASNWTVSGTNLGIFSPNVWTNIPAWN